AVSAWAPAGTELVFQETLYGAVVSAAPITVPSTLNVTDATPTLSDAFAEMDWVPVSVAPITGDVIDTVGAVVSAAVADPTVIVRAAEVAAAPALSRATAV